MKPHNCLATSNALKTLVHKEISLQRATKAVATAGMTETPKRSTFSASAHRLSGPGFPSRSAQMPNGHSLSAVLNKSASASGPGLILQTSGTHRAFGSQPPGGENPENLYNAALEHATSVGSGIVEITSPEQPSIVSHIRQKMDQSYREPNIQLENGYTVLAVFPDKLSADQPALMNARNTDISHYRMLVSPPPSEGSFSSPMTIPVTVMVSEHAKSDNQSVLLGLASRAKRVHREMAPPEKSKNPFLICQNQPDLQNKIERVTLNTGQSAAGFARQIISFGGASFKIKASDPTTGATDTLTIKRPILFGQTPEAINPNLGQTYLPAGTTGLDAVNAFLQYSAVPDAELAKQLIARASVEPETSVIQMPNASQPDKPMDTTEATTLLNSLLETKGQDPTWNKYPKLVELRQIDHKGGAVRAAEKLNAFASSGDSGYMPVICHTRGNDQQKPGQFFAIFRDEGGNWVKQTASSEAGLGQGELFARGNTQSLAQALKQAGVMQIITQPLGWL